MSGSTRTPRTLCEGLNRSLASVRAVMSIPRDCETKQGTSPIYSTCQAVQPAKADSGADIRSHPLVSDPFSSRWPVPYFCPSGATLPGLTPGALGWLYDTAPTRPGDGLSPSLVRTSSPAGPVGSRAGGLGRPRWRGCAAAGVRGHPGRTAPPHDPLAWASFPSLSCLLVRLCLRYGPSCTMPYSELV